MRQQLALELVGAVGCGQAGIERVRLLERDHYGRRTPPGPPRSPASAERELDQLNELLLGGRGRGRRRQPGHQHVGDHPEHSAPDSAGYPARAVRDGPDERIRDL